MTKDSVSVDNETRLAIAEALRAGARDVPLATCPSLIALDTILEKGNEGDVVVSFNAGESTTQGNGVVSGGTMASMLDTGIAVAVLSMLKPGQTCTTISLTVNMMRPAMIGRLRVRAVVDRIGRRVAFAHAQLLSEDDVRLATASSSLAVIVMA